MKQTNLVDLWEHRSKDKLCNGQFSIRLTCENEKIILGLMAKYPQNNKTELINDLIDQGIKSLSLEKLLEN